MPLYKLIFTIENYLKRTYRYKGLCPKMKSVRELSMRAGSSCVPLFLPVGGPDADGHTLNK